MIDDKPAEIKISELSIENERLKDKVKTLKTRIDELEASLKQANDVIEGDIKAKFAKDIMGVSNFTIEDLAEMGVEEMKCTRKVLSMAKSPYKGIRFAGADKPDAPNLTVPNKFAFGKKGE